MSVAASPCPAAEQDGPPPARRRDFRMLWSAVTVSLRTVVWIGAAGALLAPLPLLTARLAAAGHSALPLRPAESHCGGRGRGTTR